MIYHLKQPLMIVGFIFAFALSFNTMSADEDTPAALSNSATPSSSDQANPQPSPPSVADDNRQTTESDGLASAVPANVPGLALPEGAESTIIPTNKASDVRVIIDI